MALVLLQVQQLSLFSRNIPPFIPIYTRRYTFVDTEKILRV